MKRFLLLLAMCIIFTVPAGFAEETSETDMYVNVLTINGDYFENNDEDTVYSSSGIYYTSIFYKKLFNIEFTLKDKEWTILKDGKALGTFKEEELFTLSEGDEVYIANTTGDGNQ